jgi:hypothetical protein
VVELIRACMLQECYKAVTRIGVTMVAGGEKADVTCKSML